MPNFSSQLQAQGEEWYREAGMRMPILKPREEFMRGAKGIVRETILSTFSLDNKRRILYNRKVGSTMGGRRMNRVRKSSRQRD